MSFKATGQKTRPERVKPIPVPSQEGEVSSSRRSSIDSSSTFASAVEDQDGYVQNGTSKSAPTSPEPTKFSPEEEARMIEESDRLKKFANSQFTHKDYSSALSTYDKALAELPVYLDYELAVLQSNIAACYVQLREWKDAIEAAGQGLEGLERAWPAPKPEGSGKTVDKPEKASEVDEEDPKVVELPDENTDEANAELLRNLNLSDQKKKDITRIRTKLLLRRARARVSMVDEDNMSPKTKSTTSTDESSPLSGLTAPKPKSEFGSGTTSAWSTLSGALEDYHSLAHPQHFRALPTADQKTVLEALRSLPPKVEQAKKKEVDEMLGKLKEMGNGLLRPFGLSTDMFKMTQDPGTGGWSMNFGGKGNS